jgi:hypothetical protein
MLAGTCGLIEGCIELSGHAHYIVADWAADPDFVIFGGIASETDHLPLGEVRTRWSSTALAKADEEIARIIAANQTKVFSACTNVVARFGTFDHATARQ